jgi:hypothetical protein
MSNLDLRALKPANDIEMLAKREKKQRLIERTVTGQMRFAMLMNAYARLLKN